MSAKREESGGVKLTITTDSNAQKMLGVYDVIFTPGNLQNAVKGYSSVLDFYGAYRDVIEAANLLYDSGKGPEAFKRFPSMSKTVQKRLDAVDLSKLQPDIYCKDATEGSEVLTKIGEIVSDIYRSKESEINDKLSEIFEAKLPERTTLILAEKKGLNIDLVVGGHALNADPAVIGCYLSNVEHKDLERLSRETVRVALHELLHILLPRRYELIGVYGHNLYEEVLVGYFAPEGILTERLGLSEPVSIEKIYEKMIATRPYLKSYAEMLQPAIKKYTAANGGNLWEFIGMNK